MSSVKKNVGPFYSTGRRFLTVDPRSDTLSFNMVVNRTTMSTVPRVTVIGRVYHTDGTDTYLQQAAAADTFYDGQHAVALQKIAVTLGGNVFLGLDRRVAIELGTSLPIKNSPMVAHQEEYPDFVIGRWIFRSDNQYRVNDKGERVTSVRPPPSAALPTDREGAARRRVPHHQHPVPGRYVP